MAYQQTFGQQNEQNRGGQAPQQNYFPPRGQGQPGQTQSTWGSPSTGSPYGRTPQLEMMTPQSSPIPLAQTYGQGGPQQTLASNPTQGSYSPVNPGPNPVGTPNPGPQVQQNQMMTQLDQQRVNAGLAGNNQQQGVNPATGVPYAQAPSNYFPQPGQGQGRNF